jgi:hypothetical protein
MPPASSASTNTGMIERSKLPLCSSIVTIAAGAA